MRPGRASRAGAVDEHSYVVTYQKWRGEPRAPLEEPGLDGAATASPAISASRSAPWASTSARAAARGIGCGLCIDACNDVMNRIDRPRELITMDTERNQALRAAGKPPVHPIVRPRTVIYAAILLLVASVMLFGLGARAAVDINILPERNPLFVTLSDGSIRNGYTIKILNKSHELRTYELTSRACSGDAVRDRPGRRRPGSRRAVGQAGHGHRLSDLCDRPAGSGSAGSQSRVPWRSRIGRTGRPCATRPCFGGRRMTARDRHAGRAPQPLDPAGVRRVLRRRARGECRHDRDRDHPGPVSRRATRTSAGSPTTSPGGGCGPGGARLAGGVRVRADRERTGAAPGARRPLRQHAAGCRCAGARAPPTAATTWWSGCRTTTADASMEVAPPLAGQWEVRVRIVAQGREYRLHERISRAMTTAVETGIAGPPASDAAPLDATAYAQSAGDGRRMLHLMVEGVHWRLRAPDRKGAPRRSRGRACARQPDHPAWCRAGRRRDC